MKKYPEANAIAKAIEQAQHIVVVQADNPDVDSLAAALSLESVLSTLGKQVSLYCGVDLPSYLNYIPGWDRVSDQMPKQFDLSIIVDTSSQALLQQLQKTGEMSWLAAKPSVVIDHHQTDSTLSFPQTILNAEASATCEVLYELAQQLGWKLDDSARELITMGILSDTLGLMSGSTTARTIHIVGELVEAGVNLPELDEARRATLRKEPELLAYKGQLLQRVEFHDQNRIVTLNIPWEEIEKFSPLYNPPMLVLEDMRLVKGADIAIVFKLYKDGKVTAKMRANYGRPIAAKLAEKFGGGGHDYAAGFKVEDGRDFETLKNDVINAARELLAEYPTESPND